MVKPVDHDALLKLLDAMPEKRAEQSPAESHL
jgi:hypothetical protein